jgi:hypothetical protein
MATPVDSSGSAVGKEAEPTGPVVTSVYVPTYSLQGEDLPCHVRWRGHGRIEINLELPEELTIKEVYNVGLDGAKKLGGRKFRFTSYVVEGYLGLLLRTAKIGSPRKDVNVRVTVLGADARVLRDVTRPVQLFRPLLKEISVPETIGLRNTEKQDNQRRIEVSNIGDGTAIVLVKLRRGSDGEIGEPSRAREFEHKFRQDFLAGLQRARSDLPGHSRLLGEFIDLLSQPLVLDARTTKKIRAINRRAWAAYKKDKALFSRVVQVVAESYFRNLELVTELSSFLDYLNSIGEGRVVILNALDAFRYSSGKSRVLLELQIADAAFGNYPPLILPPVTFDADDSGEIPVHALFLWRAARSQVAGVTHAS